MALKGTITKFITPRVAENLLPALSSTLNSGDANNAVAAAAAWPCRMQKRLTVWQCLAPPAIALKHKKNDKMDKMQHEELADNMDNCIVITCNYMYLLCNSVPVTGNRIVSLDHVQSDHPSQCP